MVTPRTHKWEFRARFRRQDFGWKSQPAIKRIKDAVSEIKKVARKDEVLAANGAVLFLEKLSPALEQVDGSSGAIGAAVDRAIMALVSIIAVAGARSSLGAVVTPRRSIPTPTPDASATEAALEAMEAEELRALIRDIIPWMDASIHARLVNVLVDRAARNPSGWVPTGPTEAIVANIVGFAKAAKRVGYADPSDIDISSSAARAFKRRRTLVGTL